MNKLWYFILRAIPERFISQLCERGYWRGFNDGRIYGKDREMGEFFEDSYWLDRLNDTTPEAIRGIRDMVFSK